MAIDSEAEEWEALLWDLPDPSDCPFLAVVHDMPPMGDETGVWSEDSANGIEEAAWGKIVSGTSSIESERSPSSNASIETSFVGGVLRSASSPSRGIPEGLSLGDRGERSSLDLPVSGIGAIESFLLGNDKVDEEKLEGKGVELFQGLLDVIADDPTSSSADPDIEVMDQSVNSAENDMRGASAGKDEEDSDPLSKKRRRQLRNRDSALRSRERKKMYVKELEAKSRFMEFECRRLEQALALCYAENHALRLHVHCLEASRGVAAKQESAVLRMESLLLGSLLWLATFVWRVLFPAPNRARETGGTIVVGEGKRVVLVPAAPSKRTETERGLGLLLRRRFKAARKKMKMESLVAFTTHCAAQQVQCAWSLLALFEEDSKRADKPDRAMLAFSSPPSPASEWLMESPL